MTDGRLVPLHTLYVAAILSFVPVDRGESEGKELLDVSGEAYVSPYCPSILSPNPSCESELSTLTTNMETAKLKCTVMCFVC